MKTAVLTITILGIFSGLTNGAGVLPDTLSAAVGGTVNFTTTLSQTEKPFTSINWKFGDTNIITSDVSNITYPGYRDRITLFPSTGSLELRNLVLGDSGEYRVFIVPDGEPVTTGSTRLQVYEPVSNVQVTSPSTDLVEFKDRVSLSCSSRGTSLFFSWRNDTSHVTASDRVQLINGGTIFTITNVTRYDRGPFVCVVSNSLGFETSRPVNLSVSFGPENTNLRRSPSQEYFNEGSNMSLLCSADSRPAATFTWFFNGEDLPDTGPELRLTNMNMNHSGNYSCLGSNSKTLLNHMSQSLPVSVIERISGVSVTSSPNQAIEGNSVNLTCDAAGSEITREWMKDGSNLTLADNIKLYDEDRVLSFQPLTKNESGEYSCKVSNPLTNKEARHVLTVNYGPENVQIKGQSEVNLGQTFTLTCSAESVPHAEYTWIWNGTEIHDLSEYIHNNTELSSSGNYTCEARNRITMRKSSAVQELTVLVTENGGLSAGAIAGIVIACLAAVSLAVGGFFVYRKFSSKPEPNNQPNNTVPVQLRQQQQQQQQQQKQGHQRQQQRQQQQQQQQQQQTPTYDEHIYEELQIYENA